jgi:tetrahydromethanopterin S-methyltransferase subunit G
MLKDDCERVHAEQRILTGGFMSDSKEDRNKLWDSHERLNDNINELIKTISARTIQMLIAMVIGLVVFIVTNLMFKQPVPLKLYDDIAALNRNMAIIIQEQTSFEDKYNQLSGDNNKILKRLELNGKGNK